VIIYVFITDLRILIILIIVDVSFLRNIVECCLLRLHILKLVKIRVVNSHPILGTALSITVLKLQIGIGL